MAKIDEKFYKANKKFNTAFKALAEYSGTDGESKVQQVYDLMFESLFNTKTLRVLKCDCYFDNGQVVGLCEYKYDINMASKLELSKVIAQVVFYYKRIIECSKYATPNFIFIGDRNEALFFPAKNLTGFLDIEGVDYSVAPSSAGEQMELVKAIMNDDELHGSYMIVNPSECEFSYIRNKAEAIARGGVYRIPVNERTINRAFDNFMKCVSDVDLDSNELVSTFLDAIRTPEKVSYANGMIAVPGHMPVKVDHRMGGFLAYFDKPKTDAESIELTRLYDTLVKDVDRRKKGFFITPRVWVNLAHQYLGKVLGDNWEMNPNYVVWDNCYDKDTEFMSPTGWKRISEYNGSDDVLQYNIDGTSSFVKPIRYISRDYKDGWLHFTSSQVDLKTTRNHDYVVKRDEKSRNEQFHKVSAQSVFDKFNLVKNTHLVMPKTFIHNGTLHVDEYILRLAVAINADGTWNTRKVFLSTDVKTQRTPRNTKLTDKDTSIRNIYTIMVKKQRKKDRLEMLLKNANIPFDRSDFKTGYTAFDFHFPFNAKLFPTEWYNLDVESKKVIVDEVGHLDGSIGISKFGNKNSKLHVRYGTTKKTDADFVQFCANSIGMTANIHTDIRKNKPSTYKPGYGMSITNIPTTKFSNHTSKFIEEDCIDGDDKCYCFEVPSGMLIVRRNGKIVVSGNCSGTKSLTRDYRFANLYLSTLEPGEFKATEDLSPEAKETFIFDWLNDPLNKIPSSLYNELKELRKHPEKKLVFLVNPPYGQANGGNAKGSIVEKGSVSSMIRDEMIDNGLGCKGSDLFIQFNYRMAKFAEEFKLKNGQLVIGTFNNPTWMSGIGSVKFLNWYVERMNYQNGFMFNASEFQGCSNSWGIAFSTFINHNGGNESKFFKHDLYENNDGEVKNIGEKTFVNPFGKMTMDKWVMDGITEKPVRTFSMKSDGLTVNSSKSKNRSSIIKGAFGSVVSFGGIAANQFSVIRTGAFENGNDHSQVEGNFEHASIAYCCRNLIPIEWTNCKDNYFAPTPEIESSVEFKSWARDCVIYSCFSYQTSIEGEVDGEHYDFKNHYCTFKKSEILAIRGTKLMMNESEEVPYVVAKGYTTNMSGEAEDVINKYKNLLIALEPFRKEFMKNHSSLQLQRWDIGIVQIKGTKKHGFFAKEYVKKEYDEFISAYKKLGDKIRPGIYDFGFLTK